jgi:hypothetical protein
MMICSDRRYLRFLATGVMSKLSASQEGAAWQRESSFKPAFAGRQAGKLFFAGSLALLYREN